MTDRNESGASPVVSVILVVAVTVALAVGILVFLGDLASDQGEGSTSYSEFSSDGSAYVATVVDGGTSGQLTYKLNGQPIYTIEDTGDVVGDAISLSEYAQFCAGDELIAVSGSGNSENVVQTQEIESDVNCRLQGAQMSSTAEHDGESWIVSTSLTNTGSEPREFIIVLTDGEGYEHSETITVEPGETVNIEETTSSFESDAPIQVGVVSPSEYSAGTASSYSMTGGVAGSSSSSTGWTGGPSAGNTFYTPYSSSGTISSGESDSSLASRSSTNEDSSDESPVALSTNRVLEGEDVSLYATIATTKESAEETLVVQATRTNPTSEEVSRSTYTVTKGEPTSAKETFSIPTAGEYVITASLVGETDVYTAGTLTVLPDPAITIAETSLTPTEASTGEPVTIEATLENTGAASDTANLTFFESGEEFDTQEITLASGESTTVTGTYTLSSERLYQFHVGVVETAAIESVGTIYPSEAGSAVSVSTTQSPEGTVSTGQDVTFEASASHSGEEAITEYRWTFGDGETTTTTENTVTHAYAESGTYSYEVTAIAADGDSATAADVVDVSAEPVVGSWPTNEGSGQDGELAASSQMTVNDYASLQANAPEGTRELSVSDGSKFSQGDEILVIQMQDSSQSKAGTYESRYVEAVSGDTLTLYDPLSNGYTTGQFTTRADEPIPASNPGTVTQVVRIPHYTDVTVDGGTITAPDWNGRTGGIVFFRANGTVKFSNGGAVDVTGAGFRGGICGTCTDDWDGGRGEGITGWHYGGGIKDYSDAVSLNNVNGGGGSHVNDNNGGGGAGGAGHATAGESTSDQHSSHDATGGDAIGSSALAQMYLGGGGGAGSDNDDYHPRPENSHGGGIAIVTANSIEDATVYADGVDSIAGAHKHAGVSGAGAGGTIRLTGNAVTTLDVHADGGRGAQTPEGERGGSGGDGYVVIE